jgi:hypothetical protein
MGHDYREKPASLFFRQFFRIRNARAGKVCRKDDGRRHDRAGKGSPAGLVNPCNPVKSFLPDRLFDLPHDTGIMQSVFL